MVPLLLLLLLPLHLQRDPQTPPLRPHWHPRLLLALHLRNPRHPRRNLSAPSRCPPTLHLLLCLPGRKGGFGSLLRGVATKAGQKKTNNFDACRDMSGRRLRHVNAEKRLEEWRAEAEEQKLERIAEVFLKKKTKEVRKGAAKGPTEKYVEKYREEPERCAGEVEEAVRESFRLYEEQKRKALPV
ncbi:hypothetical protein QJS10_CPB12g00591 [Acorus calamus]|uniref:SDE2-like domain-containing protein n=1 Tax=Acorus calamus TaxID=4465 RepID=A0AAV9DKY0_ACOCL|nr:hypothetical protein QJS10_CPB12g00591 [Acorus calamus]